MSAIITKDLSKSYGKFKAVDKANLNVSKNKVFALLGINGAGKTTLIKTLCTLLLPSSGSAKIMGYDIVDDANEVRSIINMAAGRDEFNYTLKPRQILTYYGMLYGVGREVVDEVISKFKIEKFQNKKYSQLSTGMKQRVTLARSMLNSPKVLFLDEPTLGLDVNVAKGVRDEILAFGGTTILTTHYLREAEELADKICLLDRGKVVAEGTMKQLRKKFRNYDVVRAEIKGKAPEFKNVIFQKQEGKTLTLHLKDKDAELSSVLSQLHKLKVTSINTERLTLEEIFIDKLGGRK